MKDIGGIDLVYSVDIVDPVCVVVVCRVMVTRNAIGSHCTGCVMHLNWCLRVMIVDNLVCGIVVCRVSNFDMAADCACHDCMERGVCSLVFCV